MGSILAPALLYNPANPPEAFVNKFVRTRPWSAPTAAILFFTALLAVGCAHRGQAASGLKDIEGRSCKEPEELVDVLAKFATAVHKKDYYLAVSYLSKEDQAKIVVGKGVILDDMRRKLDALNFQALPNDPRIDLVRGRITGIFDCLPCLDQGEPTVLAKETPMPKASPLPLEPGSAEGLEKARQAMAADFYRMLQMGNWQAASGLVHPDEWKVFLDGEGNLTDLNERRLQAIEECDLDALTLSEGLLTGLVLLLEPPLSELYLKSVVFFDLVESDRVQEAIAMILESEKRFFLDEDGRLMPDRVKLLKAMDKEEWHRLYLYHDVLLGVAEAAIGFGNL